MKPRDQWVRDLTGSAQEGGRWYLTENGRDFEVAVDMGSDDYAVYSASFDHKGDGWTTFVWDISESEAVTMLSSSPWDGWASWLGEDLLIAMRNDENGIHEVHDLPGRSPFVDDEDDESGEVNHSEEHWARLARIITQAHFELLGAAS